MGYGSTKVKDDSIATKRDYKSIVKHNNLIQSRYTLEASEQKLLYKLFEHVQKNQYTTRVLELSFDDFYKNFKGMLGKNITKADFKHIVESLQDKKPYIIVDDKFTRTQWYKIKGDIDYEEIRLILDDDVFEYIQAQEKNFTMLKLESIYSFKKFYTMRIYELLKQWSNTKKSITFDLEEFKLNLNIEKNTGYKNFNNIKKRILEPAIDEINKKSELEISYGVGKEGKKVSNITFNIINKKPQMNNETISNKENKDVKSINISTGLDEDIIQKLILEAKIRKISPNTIAKLEKQYGEKEVFHAIKIMCDNAKNTKINAPVKYVTAILENLNNNSQNEIQRLKFNNFQARDYDYDKLEKQLLGWD